MSEVEREPAPMPGRTKEEQPWRAEGPSFFCAACGTAIGPARFCPTCSHERGAPIPSSSPPAGRRGVTAPNSQTSAPGVIGLLGGIGLVIGAFLPWVTATAPFVGTITRSGMDGGDGIFFIVMGVVAGLVGLSAIQGGSSPRRTLLVLVGVAAGALTAYEWSDVNSRVASATAESSMITASVGGGLILLALSSVAVVVSGLSMPKAEV